VQENSCYHQTVAKTFPIYHLFNTKVRKYEPLALEERLRWEAYSQGSALRLVAGSSGCLYFCVVGQ